MQNYHKYQPPRTKKPPTSHKRKQPKNDEQITYNSLKTKKTSELINMYKSIQRPNIPNCNLDFNFSKFDNLIHSLELQIENERELRRKETEEFNKKIMQYQTEPLIQYVTKNGTIQKQTLPKPQQGNKNKNNKHTNTITSRKKQYKIGSQFKRNLSSAALKKKQINKTLAIKHNNLNQRSEHAASKSLNKIINNTMNNIAIKKENNSNTNQTHLQTTNTFDSKVNHTQSSQRKVTISQHDQVFLNNEPTEQSPYNTYTNNNFIITNSPNVDIELAQKLIYNTNTNNNNQRDALTLKDLDPQSYAQYKNHPYSLNQIEEKVNTKITQMLMHPELYSKDASKSKIMKICKQYGISIPDHINEFVNVLIDDLLIELVYELQSIENYTEQNEHKQHFLNNVKDYFDYYQQNENDTNNIMNQIEHGNPLSPYEPLQKQEDNNEDRVNIDIMHPALNETNLNKDNILTLPNTRTYRVENGNELKCKCEKYAYDFLDYMRKSGSFYFPNIFKIYDEVIEEIAKEITEESLNYGIVEINKFLVKLAEDEIKNANKK